MSQNLCSVAKCDNPSRTRGMCKKHYIRQWRGQPLDMPSSKDDRPAIIEGNIAKIPLGINAKHGYALVDKEFAHLADSKWTYSLRNAVVRDRGEKLHHVILGKPEKGMVVDHINRNPKDNRKSNLRFVTLAKNAQNISPQKNNTSGYRGVWCEHGKWKAAIKVNYKKISLGTYADIKEAARAYNRAAEQYFGEYAVLNKIEEAV